MLRTQGSCGYVGMRAVHLVSARRTDDTGQVLLQRTEEELEKWKHPDPYIPPTAPGGSKYERNIPAPILERMLPGSVLS